MVNQAFPAVAESDVLADISTCWSAVHDCTDFVIRYAPAIRRYLGKLLRDPHDSEDVLQGFLLGVTRNGFAHASPERGRFRTYLFVALRNAAIKFRQRQRNQRDRETKLALSSADVAPELDREWLTEWQRCMLDRALDGLFRHQRQTPNNLAHTVLSVKIELPDADSIALAAEASRRCGRAVRPDAYRQHLRRARQLFARLLVQEVAQTLQNPSAEEVDAELIEVGLMPYVRPYLPLD